MRNLKTMQGSVGTALAAMLALGCSLASTPTGAAAPTERAPANAMVLSVGNGRLINLPSPMSDLFVADDKVADVQVRSPTQLYIFAKGPGETAIYATARSGAVVYSTSVRVGTNIGSVGQMLQLAMPDSAIVATPMNGMMLLTGTVHGPEDGAEAERLVQAYVGDGTKVVTRLRTATPLQVNLQVRIVEISRELGKEIGVNLLTRDKTSGFGFGVSRGNPGTISDITSPTLKDNFGNPLVVGKNDVFNAAGGGVTSLGFAGHLLGLDILSTLDLAESDGLVTTLANPNLTALSGETASFLAGGEIPIPISQQLGQVTVEYKQYGVSLAFTPTVLGDGRISMRVRPEVSELSTVGAVTLNNFSVPGITTRRAETTVELGSGQSFMIGGLLSNASSNSVEKAPWLGDLPILGNLFRSKKWKRSESELVIVVTPYLVKPVSANQIVLPTDGYHTPNDFNNVIGNQTFEGKSGEKRPTPQPAAPSQVQPSLGAILPQDPARATGRKTGSRAAAPGFSFSK